LATAPPDPGIRPGGIRDRALQAVYRRRFQQEAMMERRRQLNSGNVYLHINLAMDCGGEDVGVTSEQAAEYQRDPDGFAARYYGMSLDEYLQWAARS
jgi:hypothetical protein